MILPASKFTPITVLSFGSGELLVMAFKNYCCLVIVLIDERLADGLYKRLDCLDDGPDNRFDERVLSILHKTPRK